MEVVAAANERVVVLGPSRDELLARGRAPRRARRRAPSSTGSCPARPRSRTRRPVPYEAFRRARCRSRPERPPPRARRARDGVPRRVPRSHPRPRRPSCRLRSCQPGFGSLAHQLGECGDEDRVVVQRRRPLEPYPETARDRQPRDGRRRRGSRRGRRRTRPGSRSRRGRRRRPARRAARRDPAQPKVRACDPRTGTPTTNDRPAGRPARPRAARSRGTARRRDPPTRGRAAEGCGR